MLMFGDMWLRPAIQLKCCQMTIRNPRARFKSIRRRLQISGVLGLLLLLSLTLSSLVPSASAEEPPQPTPLLTVSAVRIEPNQLKPDQLCKLHVQLTNSGKQIASQLGFTVKINDQVLGVYGNQLFMYPIEPNATADFRLYNFWTSETSRPFPADGKMTIEVILNEAQWMQREIKDKETTWQPLGEVEHLPQSGRLELRSATSP